jgi:hypothetical protein
MKSMAIPYLVKLSVTLNTDKSSRPLPVNIGIDNNLATTKIQGPTTINFEFVADRSTVLTVEMFDKKDQEAVIIERVDFFGIADPKFAWAGVYEPDYAEPWATEQRSQGVVLKPQLSPHTYLGWNGKWTLTFSVPVFTWMHRTQNLGWIYG